MSLPKPASGAEEYLDAEIEITSTSPVVEADVHRAFDSLSGVESVHISAAKIVVRYDPTLTTREKLVSTLNSSGIPVRNSDTHRDSPIAEIEDEVQQYLPSASEEPAEPDASR